jgi:hypothetical protein
MHLLISQNFQTNVTVKNSYERVEKKTSVARTKTWVYETQDLYRKGIAGCPRIIIPDGVTGRIPHLSFLAQASEKVGNWSFSLFPLIINRVSSER